MCPRLMGDRYKSRTGYLTQKIHSAASGTLAIGVAAGSTALQVSAAGSKRK
jgi:hypothetical protein